MDQSTSVISWVVQLHWKTTSSQSWSKVHMTTNQDSIPSCFWDGLSQPCACEWVDLTHPAHHQYVLVWAFTTGTRGGGQHSAHTHLTPRPMQQQQQCTKQPNGRPGRERAPLWTALHNSRINNLRTPVERPHSHRAASRFKQLPLSHHFCFILLTQRGGVWDSVWVGKLLTPQG